MHDLTKGILPRGLILELNDDPTGKNCVIIGINPGRASPDERLDFRTFGQTYEYFVEWWQERQGDIKYFRWLRHLIRELGFNGHILWTNLAKCENKQGVDYPPIETLRTCASVYLQDELNTVPQDWQLIATGRDTFLGVAFLFPHRPVIGVPHPRAVPQFSALFNENDKDLAVRHLRPNLRAQAEDSVAHRKAIWLKVHDGQPDVETSG
jgi:Uracil DNA glycosylase superfamily